MFPQPLVYIAEPTSVVEQTTEQWFSGKIAQEHLPESLARQMLETLRCESGFVSQQSRHIRPDGTREPSFGVAQIHLPSHPEVTQEQAMDPEFSIHWMADKFRKGKMSLWSCWNDLYSG